MKYTDAILWITNDDGMATRDVWRNEDLSNTDNGQIIWTPKCIFLDMNADAVIQIGDEIKAYIPSQEDKDATDWSRV